MGRVMTTRKDARDMAELLATLYKKAGVIPQRLVDACREAIPHAKYASVVATFYRDLMEKAPELLPLFVSDPAELPKPKAKSRSNDPIAETILENLADTPNGLTRTEIFHLFSGHITALQINMALKKLMEEGLVRGVQEQQKGQRPTERWFYSGRI